MVLNGQAAIVTGGSRGIGRAVVLGLAAAGADVAFNYYAHADEAAEVADGVRALGRRCVCERVDVADQTAVEAFVAQAADAFGRLDIAVTNSVFSDREPFVTARMEGFRRTLDVTMWGAFYTVRAVAQRMIEAARGGSIVVVSSGHAYIPIPRAMAYNMAKAALDQMARTAAIELIDHKIRVNILYPGWTDTPGERKFVSDEQLARSAKKLPWKRLATPEEVARGAVFLCDPASDYITGSSLASDGGINLPWWAARGMGVPE
jgi:glucose 1-dehydrogenase